jgi:hypothetical protein
MCLVGTELFFAFGQAKEPTDMTKLIVIFRSYAKWRKRRSFCFLGFLYRASSIDHK